ncbi:adenylosuccinate synthetase [Yinghuangia sp. ASG 101]|uniref:adenylosuccinate synthetase n=1 Tax=Yinghuangia sp. ASG 101 TaxID=2896848 RepID=UPI001E315218|nr:adenylosuccinate synthetase [Yinghuangia sp. ASG 101]UGQ13288.1 adenylosuccinate synthetase [Yinghuangia sp. ASG 101]
MTHAPATHGSTAREPGTRGAPAARTTGTRASGTPDRHVAVVDLGYGDAGKGTVVAHLCDRAYRSAGRPVRAVVRFNGGAQAAHNVVADDGRHHTFAQFGAGTFTPGVATHLSRFMLVDPLALAAEADHLAAVGVPDALDRLTVDGDALLTTPYHAAANRARERARGSARHGSCGMGVGETAAFALAHPDLAPRASDARRPRVLRRKLAAVRDALTADVGDLGAPGVDAVADVFAAFASAVRVVDGAHLHALVREGPVVLEGAQGVLLDEWHGFHPYTTWSTTTFANADALLAEAGAEPAARLGVVRTYTPRHGPGPLVSEDAHLAAALPDAHNGTGEWQGAFRAGHFDAVAHRYAVEVCGGVDAVALTHTDAPGRFPLRVCRAYEVDGERTTALPADTPGDLDARARLTGRLLRAASELGPVVDSAAWPETVAQALGAAVTLLSSGPRTGDMTGQVVLPSGNN